MTEEVGGDDVVGASDINIAVGPKAGVVAAWEWGSENRPQAVTMAEAKLISSKAAPSGEHSETLETTTSTPVMSAMNCIRNGSPVAPPSAWTRARATPG